MQMLEAGGNWNGEHKLLNAEEKEIVKKRNSVSSCIRTMFCVRHRTNQDDVALNFKHQDHHRPLQVNLLNWSETWFLFYFGSAGIWSNDLELARQVVHHLSHATSPCVWL
jgi:hypothetical protein